MWCVFDSSGPFDECVASFASEAEALRFRAAYLGHAPDLFSEWVWLRFFPDAVGPEFVPSWVSWSW